MTQNCSASMLLSATLLWGSSSSKDRQSVERETHASGICCRGSLTCGGDGFTVLGGGGCLNRGGGGFTTLGRSLTCGGVRSSGGSLNRGGGGFTTLNGSFTTCGGGVLGGGGSLNRGDGGFTTLGSSLTRGGGGSRFSVAVAPSIAAAVASRLSAAP